MLQQDSSDCNDVYNIVNETITVEGYDNRGIKNRLLAFKNNTLFISSIFKINNVLLDNAKDLEVEMPMYNLIEYSKNDIKTTGSLQKSRTGSFMDYYRDESSDDSNEENGQKKKVIHSRSFKVFDFNLVCKLCHYKRIKKK